MSTATDLGEVPAALLLDPSVVEDPYPFYRHLVAQAPVWSVPGTDIVIVSSHMAVTEAVGRTDDFSSHLHAFVYRGAQGTPELVAFDTGGIHTLATADPPVHAAHRAAVFPELVSRRMEALRPDIEALTEEHLARALAKPQFEVMGELANPVPIRVVSQLIAFRGADAERLLAAAFDSTAMLAASQPLEEIEAAMGRSVEVVGWISDQLQVGLRGPCPAWHPTGIARPVDPGLRR
jgi:cytochrome P450 family 144